MPGTRNSMLNELEVNRSEREITETCFNFFTLANERYPILKHLTLTSAAIDKGKNWEGHVEGAGYFLADPTDSPQIVLRVLDSDKPENQWTLISSLAYRKILQQASWDPEILMTQRNLILIPALAHEIGHGYKFLTQYWPGYHHTNDYENACRAWNDNTLKERAILPVPGARLTTKLAEDYYNKYFNYYHTKGIYSVEMLLNFQRESYRNLPGERYADAFAASLIAELPIINLRK